MSVQHHLLSLSPEASCAVTLFREGRRDTVTAVITELPDHSGLPAERSFPDIAHKVRRMFLRDADARPTPTGHLSWFEPGERHGHGASPEIAMTHIAIQEVKDGKVVDWMEHVSDADYGARP